MPMSRAAAGGGLAFMALALGGACSGAEAPAPHDAVDGAARPEAGDSPSSKVAHPNPSAAPRPEPVVAAPPVEPAAAVAPSPAPAPGAEGPPSAVAVTLSPTDIELEIASGEHCDPIAVAVAGLPAIRGDGARVALLEQQGPANGDVFDLDHTLVILDRRGAELERRVLWEAAELEGIDTAAACQALRTTIEQRAGATRAVFAGHSWRSLAPLPVHLDRVHDLGAAARSCAGWVARAPAAPSPGEAPPLITCGGRPQTLEVAVVAGPALVVRVPGVKVWHRQTEPALRMEVVDAWEPGSCSTTPVLAAGWRDADSGLVLVRVEGEDYGMDGCGYARQHRVIDPAMEGWPELPWSRGASPVDTTVADEEPGGR